MEERGPELDRELLACHRGSGLPGGAGAGYSDAADSLDGLSDSLDENYSRFETIYEEKIDPSINRGMDIFEKFTTPKNLFLQPSQQRQAQLVVLL